ncbi:MAG: hypothetical protein R3C53_16840 [Pirellulaceae bacterium]
MQQPLPTKYEHELLAASESGREALRVMEQVSRSMSGEEKLAKAFELTEISRQIMRAGIRANNPDASEAEIQRQYVDRLLSYHGTSLAQLRK